MVLVDSEASVTGQAISFNETESVTVPILAELTAQGQRAYRLGKN